MNGWLDTQLDYVHRIAMETSEPKRAPMTSTDIAVVITMMMASAGIAVTAVVHLLSWIASIVLA